VGYVEKILSPGESVLYRAKLHWIVYRRVLGLLLLGTIIWFYVRAYEFFAASQSPGMENQHYSAIIFVIFLAVGLVRFFEIWIKRMTTEIAVTNRRVIVKEGFIRRAVIEMNATKIESLLVQQSILGRFLGYGTVVVKGTGAGIEPIRDIARPLVLRGAVADLCESCDQR
jgi:uncharacterized membrane protein YdbT with pleckstrin-like domain